MVDSVRYDEPGASETTVDVATVDVSGKHFQIVLPAVDAAVPGLATHFDGDADNSASPIKTAAGRLYALLIGNPNPYTCWLQIYDAASPTVGTTPPKLSLPIPPGNAADIWGQHGERFPMPIEFGTQIRYAATKTPTGADDPDVGLVLNAYYK